MAKDRGDVSPMGERFRKARESKGISPDEASFQTKIHPKVIVQLEEGKFAPNMSPVYIKGFIRRYAAFLGLDAKKILSEYVEKETVVPEHIFSIGSESGAKDLSEIPARIWKMRGIIIPALIVSVIIIFFISRPARPERPPAPSREAAAPASGTVKKAEDIKLVVSAASDVWLEVQLDGKVEFRHILPKGSKETWSAKNEIRIWTGKAEVLDLTLNEQYLGRPGSGVIKYIVVTRDGMRIDKSR